MSLGTRALENQKKKKQKREKGKKEKEETLAATRRRLPPETAVGRRGRLADQISLRRASQIGSQSLAVELPRRVLQQSPPP